MLKKLREATTLKKRPAILNTKLALEKTVKRKFYDWNNKIINRIYKRALEDANNLVALSRITEEEKAELLEILKEHAERVEKKIEPKTFKKESGYAAFDRTVEGIRDIYRTMSAGRAEEDTNKIEETTNKLLARYAYIAVKDGAENGSTNLGVARMFRNLARGAARGRNALLAVTETNWMVEMYRYLKESELAREGERQARLLADKYSLKRLARKDVDEEELFILLLLAKSSDRESYMDAVDEIAGTTSALLVYRIAGKIARPTKTWNAVGDKKTRPTHSEVSGTTVGLNETFIVGASEMRYPGDQSLGADVSEIAYCRCWIIYN